MVLVIGVVVLVDLGVRDRLVVVLVVVVLIVILFRKLW